MFLSEFNFNTIILITIKDVDYHVSFKNLPQYWNVTLKIRFHNSSDLCA